MMICQQDLYKSWTSLDILPFLIPNLGYANALAIQKPSFVLKPRPKQFPATRLSFRLRLWLDGGQPLAKSWSLWFVIKCWCHFSGETLLSGLRYGLNFSHTWRTQTWSLEGMFCPVSSALVV